MATSDGSLMSMLLLLLTPFSLLWGLLSSFFNPSPAAVGSSGQPNQPSASDRYMKTDFPISPKCKIGELFL